MPMNQIRWKYCVQHLFCALKKAICQLLSGDGWKQRRKQQYFCWNSVGYPTKDSYDSNKNAKIEQDDVLASFCVGIGSKLCGWLCSLRVCVWAAFPWIHVTICPYLMSIFCPRRSAHCLCSSGPNFNRMQLHSFLHRAVALPTALHPDF